MKEELNYIKNSLPLLKGTDRIIFLINRYYQNFEICDKRTQLKAPSNDIEYNNYIKMFFEKSLIDLINILGHQYGLFDGGVNINQFKTPKLINDKNHLLIAPFLYNEAYIKYYILNDLSLIEESEIDFYKDKILGTLRELELLIGSNLSWDLHNDYLRVYQNYKDSKNIDEMNLYHIEKQNAQILELENRTFFNFSTLNDWLYNLSVEDIRKNKKTNDYLNNNLILSNHGSIRILKKGLLELFKSYKIDFRVNLEYHIENFLNSVISKKNVPNYSFNFLKPTKYKHIKSDIAKFFILLSYSNYLINNKEQTISVLEKYLNTENIGFSKRTLKEINQTNYYIFSDESSTNRSNKRSNIINTIILSNKNSENAYKKSVAHKTILNHLTPKTKITLNQTYSKTNL